MGWGIEVDDGKGNIPESLEDWRCMRGRSLEAALEEG